MGDFGSSTAKCSVLTNWYGLLDNVEIYSMHYQNGDIYIVYIKPPANFLCKILEHVLQIDRFLNYALCLPW